MNFAVVQRPQMLIAGTVLRSPALIVIEPARKVRLESVWKRTLDSNPPGTPATAYLDYESDLDSYVTQIVGYRCRDLGDLRAGDVLARIPGGSFAKFTASHSDIATAIEIVWQAVWDAEAAGEIVRSYTGDFERYPDHGTVVAYTALANEERRPPK
ncbi:GyrI-like domain-containing protein [Aldersonia sp. NBC_00410]|uniref:effector binding domain-containing protein n=1 Tax=Aldersonia sp. NBC_00410 TaxID=2975954 RepID=UPI00224F670B|nr:effector binding domain-containing protein [Aldersonia sp. NBC_00410]MCX5044931.1 GyrI-like domain-containing protein [Aldersonia sp. NBC_00410]